jgi:hypothetical protein
LFGVFDGIEDISDNVAFKSSCACLFMILSEDETSELLTTVSAVDDEGTKTKVSGAKEEPVVASTANLAGNTSRAAVPASVSKASYPSVPVAASQVAVGHPLFFHNSNPQPPQQVWSNYAMVPTSYVPIASYNRGVAPSTVVYVPMGSAMVPVLSTQPCLAAPVAANTVSFLWDECWPNFFQLSTQAKTLI